MCPPLKKKKKESKLTLGTKHLRCVKYEHGAKTHRESGQAFSWINLYYSSIIYKPFLYSNSTENLSENWTHMWSHFRTFYA